MLYQRMPVGIELEATHVDEATLSIAARRMLDLDDVGTPVGEDRAGGGDERELRNLEDPKALHYLDHSRDPTSRRT